MFEGGATRVKKARRAEMGRDSWGGAASPSPPATGFGERCKLPQLGPENEGVCNFSSQNDFSEHVT